MHPWGRLLLAAALAAAAASDARAADLLVRAQDYGLSALTNRLVTLTPVPGSGAPDALLSTEAISQTTDATNGVTVFSNVVAATYRIALAGSPQRWTLLVPDTNALLNAASLVTTPGGSVGSGILAWSTVVSDARYALASENLTNWSLIPTNALATAGGFVEGGTNFFGATTNLHAFTIGLPGEPGNSWIVWDNDMLTFWDTINAAGGTLTFDGAAGAWFSTGVGTSDGAGFQGAGHDLTGLRAANVVWSNAPGHAPGQLWTASADGAAWSNAPASDAGLWRAPETVYLREEFAGHGGASGSYGELGWGLANDGIGTATVLRQQETGLWGNLLLTTSAATNAGLALYLSGEVNTYGGRELPLQDAGLTWRTRFRWRLTNAAPEKVKSFVGLRATYISAGNTTNVSAGYVLAADPAVGANWFFVEAASATAHTWTDTGAPVDTNWLWTTFWRSNGVAWGQLNTNAPVALTNRDPGVQLSPMFVLFSTGTNAPAGMVVDFWDLWVPNSGRAP